MTDYRAAGEPAARLISHVIDEVTQLDAHRRQLAGQDPVLADLLFGFEEEFVREMQGHVRNLLAGADAAAQAPVSPSPSAFKRLGNVIRRFVWRAWHYGGRAWSDTGAASASLVDDETDVPPGPIVQGEVAE